MDMLKVLIYLFIFPVIYASDDCQFAWCSDHNILIRFPFQLEKGEQHPHCGYPGFNLICTEDSITILKLPNTEEFYVRNINYLTQQIQVFDPDNCLPKRLLNLNLSGSPFIIANYRRYYSLLSCTSQITGSQFIPIECLSNSTNFVSAVPSVNLANSLVESCHVLGNVSIPRLGAYDEETFREDLVLTWYTPDCRDCESQDGMCGFESGNTSQLGCFSDFQTGQSKEGVRILRITTLSIAGLAILCFIGMACLVCLNLRRGNTHRIATAQRSVPSAIISPQPAIATTGLDESTIESYEKLVLGESRRIPGPNDKFCSICLSEYNSNETIRCIPECTHCFHAHCIDEWLRINSTCPLCRNSPSPSPLHVTSSGP